jgi:hypothetical protein
MLPKFMGISLSAALLAWTSVVPLQAKADDQAVRNSLRNSHCHATHIAFCTLPFAHRSLVQNPLANLAHCSHRTSSAKRSPHHAVSSARDWAEPEEGAAQTTAA